MFLTPQRRRRDRLRKAWVELVRETSPQPSLSARESVLWRALAAVPSVDHEGRGLATSAIALRSARAVAVARRKEARVVESLRTIGECASAGERDEEDEASFAYFCDERVADALVDVVRSDPDDAEHRHHPVTHTAAVKTQALQTVALLVSNARDPTSLYYLLSNDRANDLASAIDVDRLADEPREEIVPVLATLLRTLALRLCAAPGSLAPLLVRRDGSFPLLRAAVAAAASDHARSDAFARTTASSAVLHLCRCRDAVVRAAVEDAAEEGRAAARFVAGGAREETRRAIAAATRRERRAAGADARDRAHLARDLLDCGVRPWNVRVCERWIREVAYGCAPRRASGRDETATATACHAQARAVAISDYAPLRRMIAVATWHPLSPTVCSREPRPGDGEFSHTTALHALLKDEDEQDEDAVRVVDPDVAVPNPHREVLLSVLTERRHVVAIPVLASLQYLVDDNEFLRRDDELAKTLADYLATTVRDCCAATSAVSRTTLSAVECAARLALALSRDPRRPNAVPLREALTTAARLCARRASRAVPDETSADGLNDVVETELIRAYAPVRDETGRRRSDDDDDDDDERDDDDADDDDHADRDAILRCPLRSDPDALWEEYLEEDDDPHDPVRAAVRLAVRLRAVTDALPPSPRSDDDDDDDASYVEFRRSRSASPGRRRPRRSRYSVLDLDRLFFLRETPRIGTVLLSDENDRPLASFRAVPRDEAAVTRASDDRDDRDDPLFSVDWAGRRRFHGSVRLLRRHRREPGAALRLVLAESHLALTTPDGVVAAAAPLQSVVACAADGPWLCVASRYHEDAVRVAERPNGNLVLRLNDAGTAALAADTLTRARRRRAARTTLCVNEWLAHDDDDERPPQDASPERSNVVVASAECLDGKTNAEVRVASARR